MLNLRPFQEIKNEKKCNVQSLTSINDLVAPGEIFERPDLQVCVILISNYIPQYSAALWDSTYA
jgi:hypothetical protein